MAIKRNTQKQINETKRVNAIFTRFSTANPHPQTELVAPNPFALLVAIVLSAQATDVSVNKATPALFAAASTPAAMVALGEDRVRGYIKTIGLFNMKAKNVIALSRMLVEEYGGEVPVDVEALQRLPGVGRKTANVWLNCVHAKPLIAVDTHVFRVGNRLELCHAKTPEQAEAQLMEAIPDIWRLHAHHWLILHGRYTCKARSPECGRCMVNDLCPWPGKAVA